METYFLFIIKATITLSVFYLAGILLFRNNTRFAVYRVYLLGSILISLCMPLNKVSFRTSEPSVQVTAPVVILDETIDSKELIETPKAIPQESASIKSIVNWPNIANSAYWIIVCFLIARVLYNFLNLAISFSKSDKERLDRYTIIYLPYSGISYSFFHWIFISAENKGNTEKKNIIQHEIVHASQYHSIDVLLVELLTAVMWFNPIVWLMRKGIRQLHEYLADEGVVNSGTSILEYQTLLVNQVAGDRLISLPSGFNQSLIKKRLTMMTKIKSDQRSVYRLLIIVPLTGLAFVALSFCNKPKVQQSLDNNTLEREELKSDKRQSNNSYTLAFVADSVSNSMVTAISPTYMNVLYLGIDNPLTIAVSGIRSDRLFVISNNGIVRREGSKYIAIPRIPGTAIIEVLAEVNGKKVSTGSMEFRVKDIPEPLANIAGIIAGPISKKLLLEQKTVNVLIANFDFDVQFTVTGFKVSATIHGFVREVSSKSSEITNEQRNLFQELSVGDKLYIEDIKAVGPDGKIREMPPIPLTIKE